MHNSKEQQTNHATENMKIDSAIAKLLNANADQIKAPALKAAAEKIRKQQEEKDAETALRALQYLENQTNAHVSAIREIRKREKNLMETLKGITRAKEKFMQDGDLETLNKSLVALRIGQVYAWWKNSTWRIQIGVRPSAGEIINFPHPK